MTHFQWLGQLISLIQQYQILKCQPDYIILSMTIIVSTSPVIHRYYTGTTPVLHQYFLGWAYDNNIISANPQMAQQLLALQQYQAEQQYNSGTGLPSYPTVSTTYASILQPTQNPTPTQIIY